MAVSVSCLHVTLYLSRSEPVTSIFILTLQSLLPSWNSPEVIFSRRGSALLLYVCLPITLSVISNIYDYKMHSSYKLLFRDVYSKENTNMGMDYHPVPVSLIIIIIIIIAIIIIIIIIIISIITCIVFII